ncbi:MAG: choice-of-anchor B family protein [Phycisphaerales bacterium]
MSGPRNALVPLAIVALGLESRATAQYEHDGVYMLSNVPLAEFGARHTKAMDVWGYVSDSGREYAIICLVEGTGVVEVTDPLNPTIVTVVPHEWGTQDVKVFGDFAIAGDDGAVLQIIDLSNVDAGVAPVVSSKEWSTHNIAINEESGYAYLCSDFYPTGGWLDVVDMSDPANPSIVTTRFSGVHDAQVITYDSGPYAGREILFSCSGTEGLEIIDVSNKSNIFVVGSTTYPNMDYCHQGWLSADRQYFYVGDELDELNGLVANTRTLVFDVSDITNPTLVSEFTNGLGCTDHNLYWHDGFIYESNNASGLRIFDARSDPLNPHEVGFFDSYPTNNLPGYNGSWSVYPFLPSGTVLISDRTSGLFCLDATEATDQRMGLEVTDLIAGQPVTLSATGATPGETVYFGYSVDGVDWTPVPQLGVRLQLENPTLGGAATADGAGVAVLNRSIPAIASGLEIWIQAAERGRVSTLATGVIQ